MQRITRNIIERNGGGRLSADQLRLIGAKSREQHLKGNEFERRVNLPRAATGIRGLDEITNGGLPRGTPTLVCGPDRIRREVRRSRQNAFDADLMALRARFAAEEKENDAAGIRAQRLERKAARMAEETHRGTIL